MRNVCHRFNFHEVRVPVFEHTDLFLRGVGSTTDIVQKEMYTFEDKGKRSITLKPEGTAGVARSYVENKLFNEPLPAKLYYLNSPVFRYERPQAGRYREHHQFGTEVFGAKSPTVDAEVINVALSVLVQLNLGRMEVNINSIGCKSCRPNYQKALKEYFKNHIDEMCDSCKDRYEKNPLRILDCKSKVCKTFVADAPKTVDYLCEECDTHFAELKTYLDALSINYVVNPMIVRGLDYYTKTVFEIIATEIGAQSTVCGGGRYDGLIEEIGGSETCGMGFGMGMERLLILMEKKGVMPNRPNMTDVYIACMGSDSVAYAVKLCDELRKEGLAVDFDHMGRSMKAQFKYANKLGAKYVIPLGDNEIASGVISLRNMTGGENKEIRLKDVKEYLKTEL